MSSATVPPRSVQAEPSPGANVQLLRKAMGGDMFEYAGHFVIVLVSILAGVLAISAIVALLEKAMGVDPRPRLPR
jgi:chromate transport protein ChrA